MQICNEYSALVFRIVDAAATATPIARMVCVNFISHSAMDKYVSVCYMYPIVSTTAKFANSSDN